MSLTSHIHGKINQYLQDIETWQKGIASASDAEQKATLVTQVESSIAQGNALLQTVKGVANIFKSILSASSEGESSEGENKEASSQLPADILGSSLANLNETMQKIKDKLSKEGDSVIAEDLAELNSRLADVKKNNLPQTQTSTLAPGSTDYSAPNTFSFLRHQGGTFSSTRLLRPLVFIIRSNDDAYSSASNSSSSAYANTNSSSSAYANAASSSATPNQASQRMYPGEHLPRDLGRDLKSHAEFEQCLTNNDKEGAKAALKNIGHPDIRQPALNKFVDKFGTYPNEHLPRDFERDFKGRETLMACLQTGDIAGAQQALTSIGHPDVREPSENAIAEKMAAMKIQEDAEEEEKMGHSSSSLMSASSSSLQSSNILSSLLYDAEQTSSSSTASSKKRKASESLDSSASQVAVATFEAWNKEFEVLQSQITKFYADAASLESESDQETATGWQINAAITTVVAQDPPTALQTMEQRFNTLRQSWQEISSKVEALSSKDADAAKGLLTIAADWVEVADQ